MPIPNAQHILRETEAGLIAKIPAIDHITVLQPPSKCRPELLEAAAETGFYIARSAVTMEGRIELLQYYRQQSICHTHHRNGNLGDRAGEWE